MDQEPQTLFSSAVNFFFLSPYIKSSRLSNGKEICLILTSTCEKFQSVYRFEPGAFKYVHRLFRRKCLFTGVETEAGEVNTFPRAYNSLVVNPNLPHYKGPSLYFPLHKELPKPGAQATGGM